MSPEILAKKPYTVKTDVLCVLFYVWLIDLKVFSFGVMMWNVIAKETNVEVMFPGCSCILEAVDRVRAAARPIITPSFPKEPTIMMQSYVLS